MSSKINFKYGLTISRGVIIDLPPLPLINPTRPFYCLFEELSRQSSSHACNRIIRRRRNAMETLNFTSFAKVVAVVVLSIVTVEQSSPRHKARLVFARNRVRNVQCVNYRAMEILPYKYSVTPEIRVAI